jgi:hypothetical protein
LYEKYLLLLGLAEEGCLLILGGDYYGKVSAACLLAIIMKRKGTVCREGLRV